MPVSPSPSAVRTATAAAPARRRARYAGHNNTAAIANRTHASNNGGTSATAALDTGTLAPQISITATSIRLAPARDARNRLLTGKARAGLRGWLACWGRWSASRNRHGGGLVGMTSDLLPRPLFAI